ncbi:GNAT family N-acetyltransferase [Cytophaga sp. FL35]|uniref:GNAT family N-acetyltransferase n=1 Tax=Cytophaga sp. FL35 TaxID=1904456 RepID=UPI0016536DCD|nr:GNAT family N-acetyltransferase [Cytophaga sp. FL35]MBC6998095.1 GNAT family N-acetyltransferase [Cytophaga sp. FL35]
MVKIVEAAIQDCKELIALGKSTFVNSHGHSAASKDIQEYIDANFTEAKLLPEILNKNCIYSLIYLDDSLAGYSKITLNSTHPQITSSQATKLDRLYLDQNFYGKDLGKQLMHYNLQLSQEKQQLGMWLYVWKENQRAVNFYQKMNFKIVGEGDFKITDTHSNPNFIMYREY